LDGEGIQMAESLVPQHAQSARCYAPLKRGDGALWARRDYYKSAMAHPSEVHISNPYTSMPSANVHITLSKALCLHANQASRVLCIDIQAHYLH
jgi:hypothetical protein